MESIFYVTWTVITVEDFIPIRKQYNLALDYITLILSEEPSDCKGHDIGSHAWGLSCCFIRSLTSRHSNNGFCFILQISYSC